MRGHYIFSVASIIIFIQLAQNTVGNISLATCHNVLRHFYYDEYQNCVTHISFNELILESHCRLINRGILPNCFENKKWFGAKLQHCLLRTNAEDFVRNMFCPICRNVAPCSQCRRPCDEVQSYEDVIPMPVNQLMLINADSPQNSFVESFSLKKMSGMPNERGAPYEPYETVDRSHPHELVDQNRGLSAVNRPMGINRPNSGPHFHNTVGDISLATCHNVLRHFYYDEFQKCVTHISFDELTLESHCRLINKGILPNCLENKKWFGAKLQHCLLRTNAEDFVRNMFCPICKNVAPCSQCRRPCGEVQSYEDVIPMPVNQLMLINADSPQNSFVESFSLKKMSGMPNEKIQTYERGAPYERYQTVERSHPYEVVDQNRGLSAVNRPIGINRPIPGPHFPGPSMMHDNDRSMPFMPFGNNKRDNPSETRIQRKEHQDIFERVENNKRAETIQSVF